MLLSAITKTTTPANKAIVAPIKLGTPAAASVAHQTAFASINQSTIFGVPAPKLIDSNNTPYDLAFAEDVKVNVYGYELDAVCEGRVYVGKDAVTQEAVDILKVSFLVKGALVRSGLGPRAIILSEQFNAALSPAEAIELGKAALQKRLYTTLQQNLPKNGLKKFAARIDLLGSVGAKMDAKGYPVIYLRETVEVNNAASIGQVTAYEIVYTITNMYTNISAFAVLVADPAISAKSTVRTEQPVRLTAESFNTVEFIENYTAIQADVAALVKTL